jgi:hypothetical protein
MHPYAGDTATPPRNSKERIVGPYGVLIPQAIIVAAAIGCIAMSAHYGRKTKKHCDEARDLRNQARDLRNEAWELNGTYSQKIEQIGQYLSDELTGDYPGEEKMQVFHKIINIINE